jgi:hypothetical protein
VGMTDLQFKAHLKILIKDLKEALNETPDNTKLARILEAYIEALKD